MPTPRSAQAVLDPSSCTVIEPRRQAIPTRAPLTMIPVAKGGTFWSAEPGSMGAGRTEIATPLPHALPMSGSRSAKMRSASERFMPHATTFVTMRPTVGMRTKAESSGPSAAPKVLSA
jgi:hypothetical protein